jgi:hypothetical protein
MNAMHTSVFSLFLASHPGILHRRTTTPLARHRSGPWQRLTARQRLHSAWQRDVPRQRSRRTAKATATAKKDDARQLSRGTTKALPSVSGKTHGKGCVAGHGIAVRSLSCVDARQCLCCVFRGLCRAVIAHDKACLSGTIRGLAGLASKGHRWHLLPLLCGHDPPGLSDTRRTRGSKRNSKHAKGSA